MRILKTLLVLIVFILGCGGDDTPTINPNIVQLTDLSGYQFAADWNEDGIVGIGGPTDFYDPNEAPYDNYEPYCNPTVADFFNDNYQLRFVSVSDYASKALLVNSNSSGQSIGSLHVWNYGACEVETIRESSFNISSAHYTLGEEIIYYSFGGDLHPEPGYYWLKNKPEEDSLIYPYLSDLGHYEVVNGFDVHPDGAQLILPLVGNKKTPLIALYDMHSGNLDTLNIGLNVSSWRFNLWLRYNSRGDQILYCIYPDGVFVGGTGDTSEIGVINMSNFNTQIFDVNTDPVYKSINLFPNWSPDDNSIVYGSTYYFINGAIGDNYWLYLLHNISIN